MRNVWNFIAAIAMGAVIWSLGTIDIRLDWWITAVLVASVVGSMYLAQRTDPVDAKPSPWRVLALVVLIAVTFMFVPRWDWQGLEMLLLALLSILSAGLTWWALRVPSEQGQAPRNKRSLHT